MKSTAKGKARKGALGQRPQEGDLLLLDGLRYRLGGTKKELDQAEKVVVIRSFDRPTPASAKEAAAHQSNFNYKRGGKCLDAELVWLEPHDLLAEMRGQASQLARGNPRLAAWSDGAAAAQADALEGSEGAWTLPGRHLLKPPGVVRLVDKQRQEGTLAPQDPKEAEQLARRVLAHAHVYDQTQED